MSGKYPPGAHLHEVNTAAELDVSRTPIRDALRVLANEKLLEYFPNRGYVVRRVEVQDVLDAYAVRGALEGLACRLAAERGLDAEARSRFEAMLARGEEIFRQAEWGAAEQAAWRALNTEFHYALLELSENRHLEPIIRQIRSVPQMYDSRLRPESEFFQAVHTREQRLRSHHDHTHIVEAIVRREGARAEALMREHVYTNGELLRRGLEADAK